MSSGAMGLGEPGALDLEMFLGQKLAEREWIGWRSRSKQGLSCPGFLLAIPILNGLSDRLKHFQGFSHAVFHRSFLFSACFTCQNSFKKSSGG